MRNREIKIVCCAHNTVIIAEDEAEDEAEDKSGR